MRALLDDAQAAGISLLANAGLALYAGQHGRRQDIPGRDAMSFNNTGNSLPRRNIHYRFRGIGRRSRFRSVAAGR